MFHGKFRLLIIMLLISSAYISAQTLKKNEYGLYVVNSISDYNELVAKDSSNMLVDLKEYIPSVELDIRYATRNNFLGEPVYNSARAFARYPAATALKNVQAELNKMGFGLKIFDAYRPYSATVKFYKKVKDTVYVASAWTGSRHNRGCAVDLTIIDLKTGKPLDMPTPFDSFKEQAHSDYLDLPAEQIRNRDLLIGVMTKHGFDNYPGEWWHYDYKDWKKYPLMDLSFEQLEKVQPK